MGKEIFTAIQDFFSNREMLKQANSTMITLIPKVIRPQFVTDFRPISYGNVIYKTISKILASRLRVVMDTIIHKNQSAFIPGRMIADNIMLANELLEDTIKISLVVVH